MVCGGRARGDRGARRPGVPPAHHGHNGKLILTN